MASTVLIDSDGKPVPEGWRWRNATLRGADDELLIALCKGDIR